MPKKILILNSSPRERGNSATLANRLATGATQSGAEVESIYLHGLDIRPCDACDLCQDNGVCVIEDDMQSIYPKLVSADGIVLASPIYWFTFTAQLKLCMDRWYAYQASNWKQISGKQFGIILAYGDADLYSSGAINAIYTFESMARYLKSEIVGIVHGSLSDVGDSEKNPSLMQAAFELGQKLAQTS